MPGPVPQTRLPDRSDILSLRGRFEPAENVDVDLEGAWSANTGASFDRSDTAYRAEISGHHRPLSYRLHYIYAGSDFFGYYSDIDFFSGNVVVPLWKTLKFRGDYRQEKDNLDLNPAVFGAARDSYRRLGLEYRFRTGTSLSVDWRHNTREDRMPVPFFSVEKDTVAVRMEQRVTGNFRVSATGEWGTSTDVLARDTADIQEYRFAAYFAPSRRFSCSGFIQYQDHIGLGRNADRDITGGLRTHLRARDNTSLSLEARADDHESFGDRLTVDAGFHHSFANRHGLSVTARHTSWAGSAQEDESALMATYTVPLGLPAGRKTSTGRLLGRVYDAQTRRGVPRAIMTLNSATAVTDKNGSFLFPALKPGVYYLKVDAASLGFDRIPALKTPVTIVVAAGKDVRCQVPITRAAAVTGRIVFGAGDAETSVLRDEKGNGFILGNGDSSGRDDSADGPTQPSGLPNLLVELAGEGQIHRRVTDPQGRFAFESVRPGKWTLKVVEGRLPESHHLEKDAIELTLLPGRQETLTLAVLPDRRPIRMIRDGGALQEEPHP